jgi:hypothetical protein
MDDKRRSLHLSPQGALMRSTHAPSSGGARRRGFTLVDILVVDNLDGLTALGIPRKAKLGGKPW